VLWIDLAIALTPLVLLAGTSIGLWNRSRRLIRELRELPARPTIDR
jgi:hypothetical protein